MTVNILQELVDAHTVALGRADPPAAIVIRPALLQRLLAEDALGDVRLFEPSGRGGYDFKGLPVSIDLE